MKKLQDTAALFEVSFPDYKQLRQCRSDIILVKAVWDMVIFVKVLHNISKPTHFQSPPPKKIIPGLPFVRQASIEDWTKTPWKEINVELMDMELRRFAKVQTTLFLKRSPSLPRSVHLCVNFYQIEDASVAFEGNEGAG